MLQHSNDLWEVYADARAIQSRYQKFMRVLAAKAGCNYLESLLKNPFRAIEKLGLVAKEEQWKAGRLKDIVRGAQEMPDVAKGYDLLDLLASCDPKEGNGLSKSAGVKEKIRIVGVKNRWLAPTSGGWSDALITFYFEDDVTKHICEVQLVHADMMRVRKEMGAHKGYTTFRCALELLEATGNASIIEEIERGEAAADAAKDSPRTVFSPNRSVSRSRSSGSFGSPMHFGTVGAGFDNGNTRQSLYSLSREAAGSTRSLPSRQRSAASMDGIDFGNADDRSGSGSSSSVDGTLQRSTRVFGSGVLTEPLETAVATLQATVASQAGTLAQQATEIRKLHADVEAYHDENKDLEAAVTTVNETVLALRDQLDRQSAIIAGLVAQRKAETWC